jgi:hypothetical protein
MKQLPIGIQDITVIRQENYLYVDKTELIAQLLASGKYLFLARPRRFGKSLLVSTLREIFRGNRTLFAGLWIEDKVAWQAHPVAVLDFNKVAYHDRELGVAISEQLVGIGQDYGLRLQGTDYKSQLIELVEGLATKHGQKTVVLVDEYDKPLTDALEDPAQLETRRQILKNFYGTLKSLDRSLHFVLLTGVSKFGKVSIFSDLNNLLDLTLDRKLSCLLGYTQAELEKYFRPQLEAIAAQTNTTPAQLAEKVREWYNGYSWDGTHRLYNPFSILNFCHHGRLSNFWFETGTPTFLTKILKERGVPAYELDRLVTDDIGLGNADPERIDVLALLFQTGYLTIQKADWAAEPPEFVLAYPNREVRESFLKYLLAEYTNYRPSELNNNILRQLKNALAELDWKAFFLVLASVFAAVPYQIFRTEEAYFHSLTHVVLQLCGQIVFSEVATNRGRMDMVLVTAMATYIFEFKIAGQAADALAQIEQRGYREQFGAGSKPTYLVGVVFDGPKRNIKEWAIQ